MNVSKMSQRVFPQLRMTNWGNTLRFSTAATE